MSLLSQHSKTFDKSLTARKGNQVNFREVIVLPVVAIGLALICGAVIMLAVGISLPTVGHSFFALFYGSFGTLNSISETLTAATPLGLAALGIALGFRAGLFNIGAEGQLLLGGMAAVFVGFYFTNLPMFVHLPLALLAGAIAGALWASIAGCLRAYAGAHEVITTIMLNLVAFRLVEYLLRTSLFQGAGRTDPVSETIRATAALPKLIGFIDPNLRIHAGLFVVIAMVAVVYWLLFYTKTGFEFRAAGAGPVAAAFSGMRSRLIIVSVMAFSGALAGLAGAVTIMGVLERATPGFSGGIGFNAIAVALLGRAHPVGVILAALLFGALEAGGRQMQVAAGVSIDLILIVQALIIVFIAAPMLVRSIFPKAIGSWLVAKGAKK